jgi:hypothetical protein
MKLLILGHGGHGKDTAAEYLRDKYGMTFLSSSWAACEHAVFPYLSEIYGYETVQECFDDRHNHRDEWKHLISEYNSPDKSMLTRMILAQADCYVGLRCQQEYDASRDLFDWVIWLDASWRLPLERSMTVKRTRDMIVVDNNDGVRELHHRLDIVWAAYGRAR